jgi:hypothetical protein
VPFEPQKEFLAVDRDRELLLHFLAAIAYRTQKALREAPASFPDFTPGHQVRTPADILRHMTSLMGYTQTLFEGGSYPVKPDPLPTFTDEIQRFHAMLESVGTLIRAGTPPCRISTEQLLQGPLADTMTHVGQLALLRRLADSPVAPENFIFAQVTAAQLGAEQAPPARPDAHWPERPA